MMLVLAYDVDTTTQAGTKRLRKVAKICENYGVRVQDSVFELIIDAGQLVTLKAQLNEAIDGDDDSIRIYRLGNSYQGKIEFLGKKTRFEQDQALIF